jgi:hypothetical protein
VAALRSETHLQPYCLLSALSHPPATLLLLLVCSRRTTRTRRPQLLSSRTMQRMQRITGRFMPRTPNEADIEAMLNDFKDAEVMLEKVRSLLAAQVQGGMLG